MATQKTGSKSAVKRNTSAGTKKSSSAALKKTPAKKSTPAKTAAKKSAAKKAPATNTAPKKNGGTSAAAKKTASKGSAGRKYSPAASKQVGRELHEMHQGKLKSGRSGKKVTDPKQAIAIALSEARRAGKKVPPNPNNPKKK